jgi:hypothetical protein
MADPVTGAIYDGIKRGITVCMENDCYASAVILLFSGMDAMANLSLPVSQAEVTGADFIAWCDKYIRMPGNEQLTGIELYSARCAVLHTYGVDSKLTRKGTARRLAFMDVSIPEVRFDPNVDPTFAIVSVAALALAFFGGIDRFIGDLFSDPARKPDAEYRLNQLLNQYSTKRE